MRCALASLLALTGRAMEAMTEAQTVLTNSGVPADLRDQATVAPMWAWLGLRGNQQADQLAGTILAEPSTKRGELVVASMVALAVARWDSGGAAEALDLAAQAVRQATAALRGDPQPGGGSPGVRQARGAPGRGAHPPTAAPARGAAPPRGE